MGLRASQDLQSPSPIMAPDLGRTLEPRVMNRRDES